MKRSIFHGIILTSLLFMAFFGLYVSIPTSATDISDVEKFVTRFYEQCLSRAPDSAGLDGWVSALINGTKTGSDVAYGFVFSQEFINKNTTNEEYLQVLYEAFFNRQPDPAGLQGWFDALTSGSSREDVLNGFIYAVEFAALCDAYDIKAYDGHFTESQRGPVEAFVTRFYQLCLDRDPDAAGLAGWTDNLLSQIQTGADVANGFIYSQEFVDKNTTNDEYLTILYKAFFNRDPDQAGWDVWLSELNAGKIRGEVLDGFIYSVEFSSLCCEYGINAFAGSVTCDGGSEATVRGTVSLPGYNPLGSVNLLFEDLETGAPLYEGKTESDGTFSQDMSVSGDQTGLLIYAAAPENPDTYAMARLLYDRSGHAREISVNHVIPTNSHSSISVIDVNARSTAEVVVLDAAGNLRNPQQSGFNEKEEQYIDDIATDLERNGMQVCSTTTSPHPGYDDALEDLINQRYSRTIPPVRKKFDDVLRSQGLEAAQIEAKNSIYAPNRDDWFIQYNGPKVTKTRKKIKAVAPELALHGFTDLDGDGYSDILDYTMDSSTLEKIAAIIIDDGYGNCRENAFVGAYIASRVKKFKQVAVIGLQKGTSTNGHALGIGCEEGPEVYDLQDWGGPIDKTDPFRNGILKAKCTTIDPWLSETLSLEEFFDKFGPRNYAVAIVIPIVIEDEDSRLEVRSIVKYSPSSRSAQGSSTSSDRLDCRFDAPPEGCSTIIVSDKFACCALNGTCSEKTLEECEASNGTFQDGVAVCTEGLCPQPVGACCGGDGTCSEITQDECILNGGTYEGNGFVCAPNPCSKYVGACCGALGVCYETGQDLCESAGDTYKGTGTTCTPGTCPVPKEWVVYTIDNATCFEAIIVTVGERSKFKMEELVCHYWYYGENTCTVIASKAEMQGGFDTQAEAYKWLDGLKGEWMLNRWCPGNGYYRLNGKSGWYMIF